MLAEPTDFDRATLAETLRSIWKIDVETLRYLPVGFGSHHYFASDGSGHRWFITVDALKEKSCYDGDQEVAFKARDAAFRTTLALRRAGLEFVLAPIEAPNATVLARLNEKYAASVFPFVEGTSNTTGEHRSVEERRVLLECLGRLHAEEEILKSGLLSRESLTVPLRSELLQALDDLDSQWSSGRYGELTRSLLSSNRAMVTDLLNRFDELAPSVLAGAQEWVITHGEPHGANIMTTADGDLLLFDWDTVLIGPRERDLWMVDPRDDEDWNAYVRGGGKGKVLQAEAMELYDIRWRVSEIASYTNLFRSHHEDDANTRGAWEDLQQYFPSE